MQSRIFATLSIVATVFSISATAVYAQSSEGAGDSIIEESFEGTLNSIFAIGGETSGFELITAEKSIELAFDNEEARSKASDALNSGARVRVSGAFEVRNGVERHNYTVFNVAL